MKINKENWGRFVIDYYDDLLSEKERKALLLFLERNPELKSDFHAFKNLPGLPDEPLSFARKEKLKKPAISSAGNINEENYPEYFVLALDEELTPEEQTDLKNFLKSNPYLSEEYHRFAQTRVVPDKTLVFPRKTALKKHVFFVFRKHAVWFAAAVLLLFFGLRFLFPGNREVTPVKPLPAAAFSGNLQQADKPTAALAAEKKFGLPTAKKTTKKKAAPKKKKNRRKRPSVIRYQPVKMLAAADAGFHRLTPPDYFPLRFPATGIRQEELLLSGPVIIDNSKHHSIIGENLVRPVTRLASLFVRKNKRKTPASDKGFVKVLEKGVNMAHRLTGSEMALVKTYDENGNLIDYHLLSDNFSINHRIKNPESR